MIKKYKLTDGAYHTNDKILYRIQALEDFGDVKKGELGGFVQNESNLSHKGDCWIYENAKVYEEAKVYDKAKVYGEAKVYDKAKVYGEAKVYEKARVGGSALIHGNANVSGYTRIRGSIEISG
jgi:carbonic anhydrase/acetyltransferase-like protein (isoleucine patch superfamily)